MTTRIRWTCVLLAGALSGSVFGQFSGSAALTSEEFNIRSSTQVNYKMTLDEFWRCGCTFAAHHYLQRGTDVKQEDGSGALVSDKYSFTSLLYQTKYPGSCYSSHSWAAFDSYTGIRYESPRYYAPQNPLCIPIPGLPGDSGGGVVVCDPGHPGCGGNGGSDEPLILDLNGDGIHTTQLEIAPVLFDMNADGRPDLTGWTDPQTEEGLLFFDRNRNHKVDGNEELFGNRTPLPDGTIAKSGVEALSAYDGRRNQGNEDGIIGPGDAVWGVLRVWVDSNHDGIATNAETYSLGELGIQAIDLTFERFGPERSYGVDEAGNFHVLQGSFQQRLHAGSGIVRRQIHDVFFRVTYQ